MTTPPVADRRFIAQFSSTEVLGLKLVQGGVAVDPVGNAVRVVMTDDETNATVFDRAATRHGVGEYSVTLDGNSTDTLGYYTLTFYYELNGNNEIYAVYLQIGSGSIEYDQLDVSLRAIVDGVSFRFNDLFDSPEGGPYLLTQYQSHFTPARYAQLLRVALDELNSRSQPYTAYTLDNEGGPMFPVAKWGAILSKALYIEVLKHLRRSYLEQPSLIGGDVTRLDRRDYFDRWGILLQEAQAEFEKQAETFKIQHMMMGKPRVLVSGGVFGRYGPTRLPISAAARPHFYTRFYV